VVANFGDSRLPESFWLRCAPEPNTGCWLWTGATVARAARKNEEHGRVVHPNGKYESAHRLSFRVLVHEIPEKRNLRMTCGVSLCVNPNHWSIQLELTPAQIRDRRAWQRSYAKNKGTRSTTSSTLMYKYGITVVEFDELVRRQGGRCRICRVEFVAGRSSRRACVDHCHMTGGVRGLLCNRCNAGIGYLADSPANLRAAAAYLDEFASTGPAVQSVKRRQFSCLDCGGAGHNRRTCARRSSST
jgi:hypothetical protein